MRSESLKELLERMKAFYDERDWAQFHSPKNLVMDLASEVGELIEHFRFLKEEESYAPKSHSAISEEIGDCFIVLLHLASKLGIDPVDAAHKKLTKTGQRYTVEASKGKCEKYTAYTN